MTAFAIIFPCLTYMLFMGWTRDNIVHLSLCIIFALFGAYAFYTSGNEIYFHIAWVSSIVAMLKAVTPNCVW